MVKVRHVLACLLLLSAVFVFSSCNASPVVASVAATATPTPTPVETVTAAPTETATATPAPSPTIDPGLISPTTGLPYSGKYQPIAVIIDNHRDCWPQTALQAADVMYEITVEGGITRFMAIYNDTLPEKVGSVRSSRVSTCDLWQEWQCIYCHCGGEGDMKGKNDVSQTFNTTGIQIHVNGVNDTTYMSRDKSLRAPHNLFVDVKRAVELYDKKNYQPPVHKFDFDAQADLSAWEAMSTLSIPYGSSVTYQWDAASASFLRSSIGKPTIDQATGKQVQIKNLVVMFLPHRTLPDVYHHVVIDNVGTGKALIFRDGKYIEGTWEKATKQSPAIYKDKNGALITFTPGNTWISIVRESFKVTVK